ncbi:MAG: PQQ-binding-like beta-propeller repeat protein [Acidobacteriota bacterium]
MFRKVLFEVLALALVAQLALAADSPSFRGPDNDGQFAESGLLKSWPDGGPKLLWEAEGLGESYASVAVVGGKVFTTGMTAEKGTAYAHDLQGKRLWAKEYGAEFNGKGYPGTRSTPTVVGDSLYLLSALGQAVAMDTETGATRWQVGLLDKYKGENIYFGVSENPILVDGKLIFTPGGPNASLVALDPDTGQEVWKTEGLSDGAAYCTPRLMEAGKHRQIVTLVSKHMVGIDPETGKVLWRQPASVEYDIHATSPVFHGNGIYISHGYDQGGKLYELAADGKSVSEKWSEAKLDIHHGGAVVVGDHIYGAASKKTWYALDAATGEIAASIRRLGKGAVVHADGLLYGYLEDGSVVLVDPDPANFKVISSFEITRGSGQHWSHPVISDGVLYIRHGEVLMAYDIKDRS